ncbi:MAG TPA: hypothetical protein VIL46_16205, partial [Gemmataceae bacterium]
MRKRKSDPKRINTDAEGLSVVRVGCRSVSDFWFAAGDVSGSEPLPGVLEIKTVWATYDNQNNEIDGSGTYSVPAGWTVTKKVIIATNQQTGMKYEGVITLNNGVWTGSVTVP